MSGQALLLDYLFLREVIKTRLADQLPSLEIEGIEEFSQATEASVATSKLFIIWDGDVFPQSESARAGSSQAFTQVWSLLYAVRNAAQHELDATDKSAGPVLSQLHKAVAGWTPTGAFRPFRRTSGRKPNYRANVGIYPLTFSIDLNL
jgi:hypothetical protein